MAKGNSRVFHVLAHMLLLMLIPSQAPSDPMHTFPAVDAPDAEEIAFFEELTAWVGNGQITDPLGKTIRERPTSFEVFRNFHHEDLRHSKLESIPFGETLRHAAKRHEIDALLLASVVEAESSFNPEAVSQRGAIGLMQVLPTTAGSTDGAELYDPDQNIEAGARYLGYLLELYDGDLELALGAYNAGPGNIRRYGGLPPFRETKRYVEKVLGLYIEHHQSIWQDSEAGEILISG